MYEENCSKTLLLAFLFLEQNSSIYNFILFKFVVETKLLRPGLTVYKQISFFDFFQINIFGVMFNGNLKNISVLKLIKNPAVLLIHKFSTEPTELDH